MATTPLQPSSDREAREPTGSRPQPDRAPPPHARSKLFQSRTAPRRLIADRVAGWLVTGGGLAIIA
ncbi:MAG: hypothetical protein PVG07_15620, partial [Acidobacteriota bacterium]